MKTFFGNLSLFLTLIGSLILVGCSYLEPLFLLASVPFSIITSICFYVFSDRKYCCSNYANFFKGFSFIITVFAVISCFVSPFLNIV